MKKKRKQVIKVHKAKIGDMTRFHHAGIVRVGKIIELTKDSITSGATYTVVAKGIIYPCLGINGSNTIGYIIV